MRGQKSALIKHHPVKNPQIIWGKPLPEFVMVHDFIQNTPWQNCKDKTIIQAYHKLARQIEYPTLDVDKLYTILKVIRRTA